IIYVDDNTYLDDLLVLMLRNRAHLVGIRNSLGMCVGIVTLEDVLEEIVGEY
ncbi:MAG TPA: CBS domain-containing protein, partial [Candidatus Omnitrophica bacterium]|nr:CBS domain-containing protein [Candidatus Omnitrophota bacterium]